MKKTLILFLFLTGCASVPQYTQYPIQQSDMNDCAYNQNCAYNQQQVNNNQNQQVLQTNQLNTTILLEESDNIFRTLNYLILKR